MDFKSQLPNSYKNGNLITLDLGFAFGCHVVFTALINNDAGVCQVVTGLGAHLKKDVAIKKSFDELLQILRLSHKKVFFENDKGYIAATQYSNFEQFFQKPRQRSDSNKENTITSVVDKISRIGTRLWLYSLTRYIDGRNYIFCKVLSPDFYLVSHWEHRNINHEFEKFANSKSSISHELCPVFV